MIDAILLLGGGLLAGALGGLLGIGGGIVLMPLLRFAEGLSVAHAAGVCILAVFFTTLGGSYRHCRLGHLNLRSLVPLIISGAIATSAFSLLFGYLAKTGRWLDLGLGLVFLLVSARMIMETIPGFLKRDLEPIPGNKVEGSLLQKVTIGGIAGVLPGLLGIGTGAILVPAFTFISGAAIKTAVAASLTCFCVNAFISTSFKFAQGYVDLNVALPLCCGTLIGANLGAILNRRFPSSTLKILFGLVFAYVSLKFLFSFFGTAI